MMNKLLRKEICDRIGRTDLPSSDEEMFFVLSAIIMAESVQRYDYVDSSALSNFARRHIQEEKRQKVKRLDALLKEFEGYICEIKDFKGFKRKKYYLKWYRYMNGMYSEHIENDTQKIKDLSVRFL